MLVLRQEPDAKARDERGLAVSGRELRQTEFVRDSKVGPSLSIPFQTASDYSRLRLRRLRFLLRFGPKT